LKEALAYAKELETSNGAEEGSRHQTPSSSEETSNIKHQTSKGIKEAGEEVVEEERPRVEVAAMAPIDVEEPAEPSAVVEEASPEAPAEAKAPAGEDANGKAVKEPRRRKKKRDDQMDLFAGAQPVVKASETETASDAVGAQDAVVAEKPIVAKLPAPPPMNPAELRKAVNLIVPLLTDRDPGAKDCLKDNRTTFRSAFSAEGYVEFEGLVKGGEFGAALEHLEKAARKHGIPA